MRLAHSSPTRSLAVATVAAGLLAAGCGGSSSSDKKTVGSAPVPSASKDTSLASKVPAAIRAKGKVVVGSDASYAPMEFFAADGKTIQGVDVDLATAMGQKLGIKVQFTNAGFDAIIPGIQAGRYDMGMSSFSDNTERQQKVDFVDYMTAGTGILVKKGNPDKVSGVADLCGRTVALERGTIQIKTATTQSKKCIAAGKKAIDVKAFPKETDAQLQVRSGRATADLNDFPVAAYIAEQSKGQFEVVGQQFDTVPYGIAFPKKSGLRDAMQAALKAIVSDGTYDKILTKWNVSKGAYKKATINIGS